MFDEIFKRWIETNVLTQDDVIPLLLEWNQTFGNKKATAEEAMALISMIQMNYRPLMEYILKMVSIQKGYCWCSVISPEGRILARYMNPQ